MSENLQYIITILGSGTVGAILLKTIETFFLPKKDVKTFEEKLRNELWARVNELENKIDQQNALLLQIQNQLLVARNETITYKRLYEKSEVSSKKNAGE